MTYTPPDVLPRTAFGEISAQELSPLFQADFSYSINPELFHTHNNGGTSTVENNMAKLSTGAAANQSAEMQSIIPLRYRPGQGALARFTGLFTAGAANSEQLIGVGDSSDGFAFGYNGTSFGIKHWYGGSHEVRTLTVTTASTTAENITITLDGNADATVAVTNSNNTTTTANEIAAHDYSGLGRGWDAHAVGSTVIFTSYDSTSRTGTYSLSGATTAVGTFAQTVAGVAPTEDWTAQASWNVDVADGTDHLPSMTWTNGNVFEIQYQWLGFGRIVFYVEDPNDGEYNIVHTIDYANANTRPSINNPTIPFYMLAENTSNTSDIIVRSASCGLFSEGKENGGHIHHGVSNSKTSISTETPVLTIQNKDIFQGKENRTSVKVTFFSLAVDGTKPATFRFKVGDTLTDASYTDVSTNTSVVSYDASATASSGGQELAVVAMGKTDGTFQDVSASTFLLRPGYHLTVTCESSANTDATVSFNWEELF